MKKIIKILLVILVLFVSLLALLPIVFQEKIKEEVQNQINQNLNVKVKFEDFSVGLITTFPNFHFQLKKLNVKGIGEFEGIELANINEILVRIDLWPLITNQSIIVNNILVDSPDFHVIVLKNGKTNWDITKPSIDNEKKIEKVEETSEQKFNLSLKSFVISNANIIYEDRKEEMYSDVGNLNFTLSGNFSELITDLKTTLDIASVTYQVKGVRYLNKTKVNMNSELKAELDKIKFTFIKNSFKLNELTLSLDGWFTYKEDKMDMDLKVNSNKVTFKSILSLVPAVYLRDFESVKTAGKVKFSLDTKGIYEGKTYPAFNLKLKVDNASFKYPDLPKSVDDIFIDFQASSTGGDLDNLLINLKNLQLKVADNPLKMSFIARNPMSNPYIKSSINTRIDLSLIKDVIPLEQGDDISGIISADVFLQGKVKTLQDNQFEKFDAKGSLKMSQIKYKSSMFNYPVLLQSLALNFTPKYADLRQLDMKVNTSDFHLTGKIKNFIGYYFGTDSVLKADYTLTSKYIDANTFLSSSDKEDTLAVQNSDSLAGNNSIDSLSVFRIPKNVEISILTEVKKLKYLKSDITNITGKVKIKEEKASIEQFKLNMVGGKMSAQGFYSTYLTELPKVDFNLDIEDFNVVQLEREFTSIKKLSSLAEYSRGEISTSLTVEGLLDKQMSPVLETLTGSGVLKTKNFYIKEYPPIVKLGSVLRREDLKTLKLSDTELKFSFKEGRVNVYPFNVRLGNIKANISGSNGFDKSLDYDIKLIIPTKAVGASKLITQANNQMAKLGFDLGDLKTISINSKLTGTVKEPKVGLKFGKGELGAKKALKTVVKRQIKKIKEDFLKKARQEADAIMLKAVQESDRIKREAGKTAERMKKEARKKADDMINQTSNPFAKAGAKLASKSIIKEVDKKIDKLKQQANQQADNIINQAKKKSDKIIQKAKQKQNK